jgi:hypothetical protein
MSTVVDALNITPKEFQILQENDEKLLRFWKLAKSPSSNDDDRPNQFVIKHGLVYHDYRLESS